MIGISPLTPAFGRDYKNKKDLLADWLANKDFVTAGGQYVNRTTLKGMDIKSMTFRNRNLQKVWTLNHKAKGWA